MKTSEIIARVAKKEGLTKAVADRVVTRVFEAIIEGLVADGSVRLVGIGTISTKDAAARTISNPMTSEPIYVPAHKRISFSASSELKNKVNGY